MWTGDTGQCYSAAKLLTGAATAFMDLANVPVMSVSSLSVSAYSQYSSEILGYIVPNLEILGYIVPSLEIIGYFAPSSEILGYIVPNWAKNGLEILQFSNPVKLPIF